MIAAGITIPRSDAHGSERQFTTLGEHSVLLQAMERYEQGLLPRSMRLWVSSVPKLDQQPGLALYRPYGW